DCTEPGGGGRVLPRRIASFSCRRQEICFAGLATRGVRKSDAYAGAAGGVLWRRRARFSCRFLAAGEKWDTRIFAWRRRARMYGRVHSERRGNCELISTQRQVEKNSHVADRSGVTDKKRGKIGRASCRERGWMTVGEGGGV